MSDGITDATREDAKIIEAWKQGEIHKFLSYIPTKELTKELCKRDGVQHYTTTYDTSGYESDERIIISVKL